MLEDSQMQEVYRIQREMQQRFRNASPAGEEVSYMSEKFIVYPTVFWPSQDSMALVQSMEINNGDYVLDLCTGSGVVAVFAALKGARKVVALDINPEAIRCAKENAKTHGLMDVIDARVSDMFSALSPNEKFDVVTMNPPFTPHVAKDYSERTVWDEGLYVHRTFFGNVSKYLRPAGRIYIAHSNFGAIDEMKKMAGEAGFKVELQNTRPVDKFRTFYAFKLIKEK